ncbi:nesprin-1 isoform X3 [Labeo rohita]|uniref:Nesprin-1 isoform X3 n=1 Tax=Labeo rohita TaxID=84645 RepID=A0A498NPU1_LABRO|nr:nesprin-1 isoform X3 [Labeo rohita]
MAHFKDVAVKKTTSLNLVTGFFQYLRDEQEAVQKRTFTKWINSHLAKHKPPFEVNDLFEDIKDGVKLLALLEVLSGQRLPCEQGRQIKRIHWVSNIGTALKFLEGRKIKLVNINATDIADGRPSIVLGLIWTIILYFQIEELTSNLPALQALSSSASSVDSMASSETGSPPMKRKVMTKFQGSAKKALLRWVQNTASKRLGIEVKDFGPSWRSGVAFHSVIHAIRPELVDMDIVRKRSNRENLEEAFSVAENELGIPRLLDPEDVDVDKPDEKSIMTYVAQFLKHYPDPHQSETDGQQEEYDPQDIELMLEREERKVLREVKIWLDQLERDILHAQGSEESLTDKYQAFKNFRVQYEMRKKQIESLLQPVHRDGKLSVDQAVVKQAWDHVTVRLLDWHIHLDKSLPGPLGVIGAWLHRAELSLREDIPIQQAHEETANIIHRKLEQHKEVLKNLEGHRQTFQQIHRDRSVNGVPVPPEQLQDMAERFNFVSTSSHVHLIKFEFWEMKYRLMAFLMLAESKLKSWIIKYGRRDSVELLLQNYIAFIEGHKFFEQYETTFRTLKQAADSYLKSGASGSKNPKIVEEVEGVNKFLSDATAQWKNLSVEVRSVRSMLEEVICNWEKYSSTVASLQAWLEDAEKMLNQSESDKREFFRNLPHWIQQHMDMNDAGNFLIETCDETVSRELKQQLLLLNGRWRELFVKVKHYARADEVDKLRKDYDDGIEALKAFIDSANERMNNPVQVSFLNIRTYLQDVEDIKHKVPSMEAAYKTATRNAQQLTKDLTEEEIAQMLATMATIKDELSKIRERALPLLRDSQAMLPPLEEMEKHITGFYQSLEKASRITSSRDSEAPGDFKQKCQELVTYQQSCKKCLSVIDKNHQIILKSLDTSKNLKHLDTSLLERRITELQASSQGMVKETTEWKRHVEANSSLMKRFEESRVELEKVLKIARSSMTERGNPEDLLKKHTEFFGQLDQRVLNAFLKACDELTDILPEQEQQNLQETVRKLHKQWKDVQTEIPSHLLHLKVELEKSRLMASVQECQAELARENRSLPSMGSERLIKEHRMFFKEKGPQALCEKRLQHMEELCSKLPENKQAQQTLENARTAFAEAKEDIDSTHQKLMQHPDKWKEFNTRFSELSAWVTSKESQLRLLRNRAGDPSKFGQVKSTIESLRNDAELQEGNVSWLKTRLAALIEVCTESDAQRQGAALSKLSNDFKGLLTSLSESEKVVLAVSDCVQFREEVKTTLEELTQGQQELQSEISKILDSESVREAQQLLLLYQQQLKRLRLKRKEMQEQINRGKLLQVEEGLEESLQEDLQKLETTLSKMDQSTESQEKNLEVTLAAWQEFDSQQAAVKEFVGKVRSVTEKEMNFSSPDSLSTELEQAKELLKQCETEARQVNTLLKRATEIQLGPKNQSLLQDQARALSEQVDKVETGLKRDVKTLEGMKDQWDSFGSEFEAFSTWITERERQMDALKSSSAPLDQQICTVKTIRDGLQERSQVLSNLEEKSQALVQFVSSGESARIKARLTQIGRYWEELKESVEHLNGQLEESSSYQTKFNANLQQVQSEVEDIQKKLDSPVTSCVSSSETYKTLQSHMDMFPSLEKLKATLLSLSAGARRLSEREKAEKAVAALQQSYEKCLKQAKEKQNQMESLLSHWQKYEKDWSALQSCLERCKSISGSDSQFLPVDKLKLDGELLELKHLQSELQSLESVYNRLVSQTPSLYTTASDERVKTLKEDHEQLEKRWKCQTTAVPQRIQVLQEHLSQVEQFDQALQKFFKWGESFLSSLHSFSHVDITDLQPSTSDIKGRRDDLLKQSVLRQSLQEQTKTLCDVCEPNEVQQLQGKWESSLQPYMEAHQLVELRGESLDKLEAFLHTHTVAAGVLQGLRQTVESAGSWDKSRVDELQKDLEAIVPDISRLETLAVNLDGSLCKAHLHLMNGKETRSSCRSLADSLSVELDAVRNLLGSKQSEAEALGALWSSFRQRKEQLLKTVEDIEEKADKQGLKEPNLHTLQQRLRFFNQLEDELQSHQHEEQWLRDKGQQLAQRDAELGGEVLREINLLQTTWEDTKKLITERQEQSSALVELMKDYQSLKSSINTILESADAISDIKAVLKDQEDTRRSLLKHEAVKAEMASNQDVLERFSSKGKKLLNELNKIPDCDTQIVKTEMDATVDQWLDVSEKIEDNLESLKRSSALWVEIYDISGEIESWSNSSVMDLTDGLNNFNDSQKTANKLSEADVGLKEKKIDALQEKVSELKQLCGGQDVPAKLQVMETDLRRKISNIEELCNQSKSNLQDFCSQKKQLEDFLTQMSEWLQNVERSLVESPCGTAPEEICRVKEIQKELQNQQSSIDSARESLNTLCRKYPSEELAGLGSSLTDLIKKYETVNQLCVKKLGSMQHGLQQHFNDLVKEFHTWLSGQKDIVRECADYSGDMSVVERKLQKLKGALERVDDGDGRLMLVCTEGEKLLLHLPKASAGQVQQNLSSIQQDWDSYVEQCKQNQQNLEESANLLSGFESRLERLTRWLERMDVRMSTELPEGRHGDQERVTLERVEEFQHEVLKERDSFESLCQEAQSLSEGGHGSGAELRVSAQLQLQHQALLKAARERLRLCQLSMQEQQNFEETLQSTWGWLSGVQERLNSLNSTSGNKETLEKRLGLVQDILLMKGEGEVKLNMTVGKGEQVLKNCSRDKQEIIRSQLKSLKDSWANILMTAMSCHSRLEWTVAQWGSFLESKAQLQQWMEMVEQEAGVALPQQPGLKEKASLLERLRAIQADVEVHLTALTRLNEKATELYEKTGDQMFAEGPKSEFNTQFTNITSVIKNKVQQMEEIVKEHEQYMESVRDLNDWLTSAKEELQRWSDMSGDAASVQRKLSKVRGLLDSRKQGHERLTRVQSCGAATRDHTSTVGCEVLEREEGGLLSAWEQWERGAKHVCSGLEGVLAQMANSEQEFNSLAAQLEQDLQEFSSKLQEWRIKLQQVEDMTSGEEAVQGWQIAKDALEALLNIEPMSDNLKCQLNDLCRFSRDLGAQSERVSALIKEYNSLSLQASRECQGKEKLLEQRFRASFRDFQQWLVNAKINTAKCFDVPQNLAEASSSLQKIQEFLSDREQGHGKLNTVAASGELLMSIAAKDRVESVRAKINTAREDWKTLMTNLHQRETALQNLQAQMRDFETSVEPLQDWLNETEEAVQESSSRLHDLTAKKQELHRLQV